jgi:hypothetical protein
VDVDLDPLGVIRVLGPLLANRLFGFDLDRHALASKARLLGASRRASQEEPRIHTFPSSLLPASSLGRRQTLSAWKRSETGRCPPRRRCRTCAARSRDRVERLKGQRPRAWSARAWSARP